jgi:flavin-dependent dehydrogenase
VQGLLVTPRLVIGADGLCSGTRKAAAIRTLRPQPSRFGARQHFRVEPWTDHVEVFWAEGVEAYVTPVARDQVNVAFLWDDSVTETRGGQDLGRRLLRSFPELAARLRGVEASDRLAARGPLHVRVPMPARDGVLLVGDAAGYVDALTGEGVGLSALQARLLARRLARELRSSDKQLALEQLRPFLNETRRLERSHMVLTRLLLQLRRSPWLVEQLTGVFVKNPALFRYFLSLNQGRVVPLAVKRGLAI